MRSQFSAGKVALWALAFLLANQATNADIISVNPRATYFRTAATDSSLDAIPIDLGALGFLPGAFVDLAAIGDFGFFPGNDGNERSLPAVFSSSAALLASSNLNRVVGAIDAGADFLSGPTFSGSLPTDIPEDFLIPHVNLGSALTIQVPTNATHLFVSVSDSLFEDNGDPNGNLAISITSAAVPEPSSWALLSAAGIGLVMIRRRRSRERQTATVENELSSGTPMEEAI